MAGLLQRWAHKTLNFQHKRLERVTISDCIIAVAEHINNPRMMHIHAAMAKDIEQEGVFSAYEVKLWTADTGLSPNSYPTPGLTYVKLGKTMQDDRFLEKLCCMNTFHYEHWKYVNLPNQERI